MMQANNFEATKNIKMLQVKGGNAIGDREGKVFMTMATLKELKECKKIETSKHQEMMDIMKKLHSQHQEMMKKLDSLVK